MTLPIYQVPCFSPHDLPRSIRSSDPLVISFGKLETTPYIDHDYWCVNFPHAELTFIVEERTIKPDNLEKNTEFWASLAVHTIRGDWCMRYECLWTDVKTFEYKHADGPTLRYGLAYTLKQDYSRPIWFLGFPDGEVFFVDEICISERFLGEMPADPEYWRLICWGFSDRHRTFYKEKIPVSLAKNDISFRGYDSYMPRKFFIPRRPEDWLEMLPLIKNYQWNPPWSKGQW